MRSLSRWLVFALCIIMMASVFAGCGAEKETPAGETKANEAPAKTADNKAPAEKIKITYSNWGTQEESATIIEVANKFNSSQDKIQVEIISIPNESYMTKLNTMATAGELPDTGIMNEAGVLQWATQGMLADISSMYEGSESKPLDCITFKYQGKPVAYSVANEILVLYYNKDMFDAAGVPYPPSSADKAWTWDEFVETAKKLTFDQNGKTPNDPGFDPQNIKQYGCMVENFTWQLETWALSNGSGWYSKDGSKVTINDPAAIESIQKVADLYLKHHVAPLSTGTTDDGMQRSIMTGTVAMATGGTWNVGTCLNTWKAEGHNYGIAVLPKMKEYATICTGGPNVVFNQSKHLAEAMEWIKWYAQEENSWTLFEQGIWMPILEKYYTDETLTRKWVENPNFPEYNQYKSAVVDVAKDMNLTRSTSWYYVNNTVDFNALLQSILGEVWTGNITAEKAINDNYDALVAAFKGE